MAAPASALGSSTAVGPDSQLLRAPGTARRRTSGAVEIFAGWRGPALAATAVTLLNWPGWLRVNPGLDQSWQAGLAVAFTRHIQWGPQLDFTYGPYGFAGFLEPFYRSTAFIAVCFVFAVTWLLAYLVVAGLRQYWPVGWDGRKGGAKYWGLAAAASVAWVLVWLSWAEARPADFVCVTGLGLSLCLLRAGSKRGLTAVAAVLGALTGFAVLVKLNSGLILAGLLALALIGAAGPRRDRWRSGAVATCALITVFAVAWVSAGQSFRNLASFAHASASLLVGYGTAMAGALERTSIAWLAAGMVLAAALVFAAAFWLPANGATSSKKERLVAGLMLAGWGWAEVKEGFVSGDHFPLFFRVVLVAVALAALVRPPRALFAGALAAATCITLAATTVPALNPGASLRSFGRNLADIAQPARFALLTGTTRQRLLRDEPLPASAVSLLRGRSVAIEPWEDLVAWADPGLRWDPEPVVQAYSAFTVYLDREDADFLTSAKAPERILNRPLRTGFDFRDPVMDPPATTEAMYCRYTQLALASPWQILERVPDRCGPAVPIGTVTARFGQPVAVPSAPGKMVVASFTLSTPLLSRVEEGLLKPPDTYLVAWPGTGKPVTYRFVTGTAADNHVLSVPTSLGYSPAFTPTDIYRLEFSGGGWKAGQGTVRITFRAVSLSR